MKSRQIVRERLGRFTFEAYSEKRYDVRDDESSERGFLDRIRSLCLSHGAPPEGWTDYQLLLIAGIGPNITSATTWLIYHLLAQQDSLIKVRKEIDMLVEKCTGSVDLASISEACPVLQATWIETLRFHGTFTLGRYVHENTILADTYLLPKGSYALAPLRPHHFDHEIWGEDADEFKPERFLINGKFDHEARKKLRAFGVFGTICPGRFLAGNMAMALTIRLLSTFDMELPGGHLVVPEERKDSVVGLATPDRDVSIIIKRRSHNHDIKLTWKT